MQKKFSLSSFQCLHLLYFTGLEFRPQNIVSFMLIAMNHLSQAATTQGIPQAIKYGVVPFFLLLLRRGVPARQRSNAIKLLKDMVKNFPVLSFVFQFFTVLISLLFSSSGSACVRAYRLMPSYLTTKLVQADVPLLQKNIVAGLREEDHFFPGIKVSFFAYAHTHAIKYLRTFLSIY